jgi:hypothetical protein
MKALRKNVYRVCWAIVFGQLVFAVSLVAADLFRDRYEIQADDGWTFLAWPVGIAAGWLFANRSLAWRRLHIVCLMAGGLLTPILVSQAVRYHQQSQALKGSGFLAGLGEAISAAICIYLSVSTLCLFIAGAATTFNGWRFGLRTLLVGMTLVALALGAIFVLSR